MNEKIQTVTFRPNDGASAALKEWDQTGYGRSMFINVLLVKYGDAVRSELPAALASMEAPLDLLAIFSQHLRNSPVSATPSKSFYARRLRRGVVNSTSVASVAISAPSLEGVKPFRSPT